MERQSLLIVSPVFCEAKFLDRVAAAVAAQTRPPDRWVIVDDGSTDDTLAVAQAWEAQLPYLTVVGGGGPTGGQDGLARARDARAFNRGLDIGAWRSFTHIGKLDGDVELPADWCERLLGEFAASPALGLAGGRLIEEHAGRWRLIPIPDCHVHGAVKLYSRACLEAIGGIPEQLGWDTIDETYARMRGFRAYSTPELVARHLRPWASARGRLRGYARHGDAAWILHQPSLWVLARGVKLARNTPMGLSGAAFVAGYARSAVARRPRVPDPAFRVFVRRELRERVRQRTSRPHSRAVARWT